LGGVKNTPFNKGGGGGFLKYKIVETEAYNGPNDLASHASIGRTERNKIMFDGPGTIYVYFTYGMHYMLNIVTEEKGYPAAVLIRALEPLLRCHCERSEAISAKRAKHLLMNFQEQPAHGDCFVAPSRLGGTGLLAMTNKTNGPARLTKTLKIDKSFNGLPIYTKKHGLWIESPPTPRLRRASRFKIVKTTRVGIDYARGYKNKKWRFYIKGNKFVSKK
jgi:DNA-3-methyladenine glycosylase